MGITLPDTGFVRLPQIIGSAKARPPIPALIPVSTKHLVGRGQIRPLSRSRSNSAPGLPPGGWRISAGSSRTQCCEVAMEWVKVRCDIFEHRKIRLIRKGPKGDTLVLLWLMLIAEAGKCGRGGALMISENKPYTAETLSLLLAIPESIIEQGLELFARLEMIERDEVIRIRNWRKYQSEDKLEIRREKDRLRQQRHREKEPEVSQSVSRDSHATRSRDVTPENRTEKNRVEKTTTEGVRLLLSQTPLSNISDQELGVLMQRHGPGRVRQAADVAAETWRRDRGEIRNPGGYLNTLCEALVIPDWYVPPEERQKRAQETQRRQEVQTAGLVVQQKMEAIENQARDELWQRLSDTERDQFCSAARDEYPVCTQPSAEVVQILAKMKAWEARQESSCS
jgi:predicted phage replisome organizer